MNRVEHARQRALIFILIATIVIGVLSCMFYFIPPDPAMTTFKKPWKILFMLWSIYYMVFTGSVIPVVYYKIKPHMGLTSRWD